MNTYWFFDTALKRVTKNAKNVIGSLKKDCMNPLCMEGKDAEQEIPWELRIENGYPNVFFDPLIQKYRCYYTSYIDNADETVRQKYGADRKLLTGILYAESNDGVHWIKPALGAIEYRGNTDNNIIGICTHGAGVLLDMKETDPSKRYKMVSRDDRGPLNIFVAFSPDGIHFGEWIPVINDPSYPGDTHNFVIRNQEDGRFLLYTRKFARETRVEARFVSEDFIHWSDVTEVLSGVDMHDQIYGMPVFFQDDLYWGLAEIYDGGDTALPHFDHVDVELCYSGDGVHWQRIAPGEPFIPNGPNGSYDSGCCYASVPVRDGMDDIFYYMGGNGTHYGIRNTGLCRARIDRKRFAGVTSRQGKEFMYQTRKLMMKPMSVYLCADVSKGGSIVYEALDKKGEVIQELSKDRCVPVLASSNCAVLRWKEATVPDDPCMIRFYCQDAVLYSISGDIELKTEHPL
jgi:hypothetical protein